jgi:predicted phage terminase large subunit-like protein
VFTTWGKGVDDRLYLLARMRGKWDSVDLEKNYIRYLKRLKFVPQVNNMGPRLIGIEDKASGIGLIQSINRKIGTNNHTDDRGNKIDLTGLPKITPIPRGAGQNKVPRALSSAPHVERGELVLPENAPWIEEYLDEVCSFSVDMTHSHDDQCDPTFDAVHHMLIGDQAVDYSAVVGQN